MKESPATRQQSVDNRVHIELEDRSASAESIGNDTASVQVGNQPGGSLEIETPSSPIGDNFKRHEIRGRKSSDSPTIEAVNSPEEITYITCYYSQIAQERHPDDTNAIERSNFTENVVRCTGYCFTSFLGYYNFRFNRDRYWKREFDESTFQSHPQLPCPVPGCDVVFERARDEYV